MKRKLAIILASLLVFSSVPAMNVYAADPDSDYEDEYEDEEYEDEEYEDEEYEDDEYEDEDDEYYDDDEEDDEDDDYYDDDEEDDDEEDDDEDEDDDWIDVKSIKLSSSKETIFVGKTVTLKATVSPSNASEKEVWWDSDKPKIAVVDEKGVVTGLKEGTAVITACSADDSDIEAKCTITVKASSAKVTSVTLNQSKASIVKGNKITLKATVKPTNATNKKVTWSSSKPSVATVNSKGVVTAVGKGKATITATAADGSKKKASCTVTVTNPVKVKKITLNKTKVSIKKGKTFALKATIAPANATDKTLKWESSNKKVATVDKNGKITAKKAGNCTITATSKDGTKKKATCKVTVK